MDDPYAIEGTGAPETRLDIDEFSTNPAYKVRWDLFLRALAVVQTALPEDRLGYYRIAGIHGFPIVTWPELEVQPGKTIYCSHGNVRFPTWHRPYLLLLEQAIVKEALILALAAPPPLVALYTAEAQKIRIPFWDWARVAALPNAAINPQSSVIIPEQGPTPTLIPNPLYSYTFTGPYQAPAESTTTRFPDDTVRDNLVAAGLRANVYHALTINSEYAPFSNTRFPTGSDSIEKPHNSVHNAISLIMQEATVTAFDPIFWLFHCVMDYYYELWQTVNADVYYSENQPDTDTIDFPLLPFHRRAPLGAWTSRMIQRSATHNPNSWVFGVQYPETQAAWTPEERLAAAHRAIMRYGPLLTMGKLYPPGAVSKDRQFISPGYPNDLPAEASIRREWRVMIKVKNNIVASNFTIFVFLGESGESRDLWGSSEATVGSFSTFKAPLENCENCRDAQGEYIYGSIYLTDKLLELMPHRTHLEDRDGLTPWLIEKLDWRIRTIDGAEFTLPAEDTTSLYVGVESFMEAYVPLDDAGNPIDCDFGKILGRTFDRARHPDVTRGKSFKGGEIITA